MSDGALAAVLTAIFGYVVLLGVAFVGVQVLLHRLTREERRSKPRRR